MAEISEKYLESMIFNHRHSIHERGFIRFYANTERQFRIPNGLIMDLFTYEVVNETLYFKIIELKVGAMGPEAIFQLVRYFSFVHDYIHDQFKEVKWELVLVGDCHSEQSLDLKGIGIKISFYKFHFGFDGLFFTNESIGELVFNDGTMRENKSDSIIENVFIFSGKLKNNQLAVIYDDKKNNYLKRSGEEI